MINHDKFEALRMIIAASKNIDEHQLEKIKLLYDSLVSEQHTNIAVFDTSGNLLINFHMVMNQPERTIKYTYVIDFDITHIRLNRLIEELFKKGITRDDMYMFNIAYANYKLRLKDNIKANCNLKKYKNKG